MSERRSRATVWIDGLFGGRLDPPRFPGQETRVTGSRAVRLTESLLSDTLVELGDVFQTPHSGTASGDPGAGYVSPEFGERPRWVRVGERAGGAVATASGLGLYGRRVAVFLPAGKLDQVREQLRFAVRRQIPLVLHATLGATTHDDYHAVADSGAFMVLARDGQQAADLTLAARRLAETSLTPGIVAIDGPETAWTLERPRLAAEDLARELVGDADDEVDSPTPAQALLFGERRRRVPRWFDPDRPTAHGVAYRDEQLDAAVAGRAAFFTAHLRPIAQETLETLSELTGRPMTFVSRHRLDGARQIIVAQGSAVGIAEAVADRLRKTRRARLGVLGVTWLRPFPAAEVREALSHAEQVTVLERTDEVRDGDPPLLREVRAATRGSEGALLSATYARLRARDVLAVWQNMESGEAARRSVRLGLTPQSATSVYPKREALEQRLRRDYPRLEESLLPPAESPISTPEGVRSVALRLSAAHPPENELESLARLAGEAAGPHVRGRLAPAGAGLWNAHVTACREPLAPTGEDLPADVLLVDGFERSGQTSPFAGAARAGAAVVASEMEASDLWAALPAAWREDVRRLQLRLFVSRGGPEGLVSCVEPLLSGESGSLEEVRWKDLDDLPEAGLDPELPLVVRRFAQSSRTYDSVPRFWGEFAQPRSAGEPPPAPDPYQALGAVPACTSTFEDQTPRRTEIPRFDPALCTGCGKCWTACPDSAIAPAALGTEVLLNVASAPDGESPRRAQDPAAAKLARAHRQLAGRLDGSLAEANARVVPPGGLGQAFDWLVGKMNVDEDERPALERAFEATRTRFAGLPLAVTDFFFHDAHRRKKGNGELLALAVNPQACQGCGLCAEVCADGAIEMAPQTAEAVDRLREIWHAWEGLPDTAGETIARAGEDPRVGKLPSILMARSCLFAVAGGNGSEPGSGERIAARQIAALVEYRMQQRWVANVESMDDLALRLREAVREAMARAVSVDDLQHLDAALGAVAAQPANLGPVLSRLEQLGERTDLDVPRLRQLVRIAREIDRRRWQTAEGAQGVGRARFGLVIAGRTAAEWAATFPGNPFGVPLTVDLAGTGPELALGLLTGLMDECVADVQLKRRAELLLEAPPDAPAREREIESLTWRDLEREERALCPPVLVLAGPEAFGGSQLAGLSTLLTSEMPVKVVLLDGHDLTSHRADPALLALAHRRAFVLAASLAHPDHLFEGMTAALAFGGPAMLHLHTPSPSRHGHAASETLARARLAVECRVHPLLRYDPAAEGVFGRRVSLDGNPDLGRDWTVGADGSALTPAHWAAGERRFDDEFPSADGNEGVPIEEWTRLSPDGRGDGLPTVRLANDRRLTVGTTMTQAVGERLEHWTALQELAGEVTPFTASVEERVEHELRDAHRAEVAALKAEHEREVAKLEGRQTADQVRRLRDRLLQLAGYGKRP